jgi:hypothetical protein
VYEVLLGEMLSFSDVFGAFLIIIGCIIDELNMNKLFSFFSQKKITTTASKTPSKAAVPIDDSDGHLV